MEKRFIILDARYSTDGSDGKLVLNSFIERTKKIGVYPMAGNDDLSGSYPVTVPGSGHHGIAEEVCRQHHRIDDTVCVPGDSGNSSANEDRAAQAEKPDGHVGKTGIDPLLLQNGEEQSIEFYDFADPGPRCAVAHGKNGNIRLQRQSAPVESDDVNFFKTLREAVQPPGGHPLCGMIGIGADVEDKEVHGLFCIFQE